MRASSVITRTSPKPSSAGLGGFNCAMSLRSMPAWMIPLSDSSLAFPNARGCVGGEPNDVFGSRAAKLATLVVATVVRTHTCFRMQFLVEGGNCGGKQKWQIGI